MRYFDSSDLLASLSWIARKDVVKKFELEFNHYLGSNYTIATSYGRTALYLGLLAIDVKDKEVIIPAFICTVVRHAIVLAGAIPKFVDISYDTLGYDIDDLKNKITPQTKAIVITHYFGMVAPYLEDIISLADEKGILVIEDCAHALGAEYKGKKVGTFGKFSIFSLTKNTINYGGGVLVTDDKNLFLKSQDILKDKNHSRIKCIIGSTFFIIYGLEQMIDKALFDRVGKSVFKWWLIKLPGFFLKVRSFFFTVFKSLIRSRNSQHKPLPTEMNNADDTTQQKQYPFPLRMTPITASVGIKQLHKIDDLTDKRRNIVTTIAEKLNYSFTGKDKSQHGNAYSFLIMRFENKDVFRIISHCRQRGLLLRATWPTHQTLWNEQDTPTVRRIERSILTWNVNPMLTNKEINKFIKIINTIFSNNP